MKIKASAEIDRSNYLSFGYNGSDNKNCTGYGNGTTFKVHVLQLLLYIQNSYFHSESIYI